MTQAEPEQRHCRCGAPIWLQADGAWESSNGKPTPPHVHQPEGGQRGQVGEREGRKLDVLLRECVQRALDERREDPDDHWMTEGEDGALVDYLHALSRGTPPQERELMEPGEPRARPEVFIQWKGTEACLDFTCTCGRSRHYDEMFLYSITCDCGLVWWMPSQLPLTLEVPEWARPSEARTATPDPGLPDE